MKIQRRFRWLMAALLVVAISAGTALAQDDSAENAPVMQYPEAGNNAPQQYPNAENNPPAQHVSQYAAAVSERRKWRSRSDPGPVRTCGAPAIHHR